MNEMSVNLLAGIIFFLFLSIFVVLFFDVVLVYFYELIIPVFGVNCVYDHENIWAQFIMHSLLILKLDFKIAVLFFSNTVDSL